MSDFEYVEIPVREKKKDDKSIQQTIPLRKDENKVNNDDDKNLDNLGVTFPVYKLLVIGMSGAGKSTFINSIQNYLSFESLGDALEKPGALNCVVPTVFSVKGSDYVKVHVRERPTEFNANTIGSNTKDCTTYRFIVSGDVNSDRKNTKVVIELVDTPGINDSEGEIQDAENHKIILSHIKSDPLYNSVVFILQEGNCRFTPQQRTNLNNILKIIPKSAFGNIAFSFTNSSPIPQSDSVIEEYLEDIASGIQINHGNTFGFENKGYQYLVMQKTGMDMNNYGRLFNRSQCDKHWMDSRDEMIRFFRNFVLAKEQVDFSVIIAANYCSEMLDRLSGAISCAAKVVYEYNNEIKEKELEIQNHQGELQNLNIFPRRRTLGEAKFRTIRCTNNDCENLVCCDTTNDQFLDWFNRGWWWFGAGFKNCKCKHSHEEHYKEKYEFTMEYDNKPVEILMRTIYTKADLLEALKNKVKENLVELDSVLKYSAQLRSFLKTRMAIPTVDVVENEMNRQINEMTDNADKRLFLEQKLKDYLKYIDVFNSNHVELNEIDEIENKLKDLEINGSLFKNIVNVNMIHDTRSRIVNFGISTLKSVFTHIFGP